MRLIKGVTSERENDFPQGINSVVRITVFFHSGFETDTFFRQNLGLLLPHRFSETISLTSGIVGHLLRDFHDLLLVNNKAVRLRKNVPEWFLQFRVDRGYLFTPVLAVSIGPVRTLTHRAWTIQRQRGNNIREFGWAHAFEQFTHATTIQLEHTEGIAARKQLIRRLVDNREALKVEVLSPVFFDVLDAVADNGEVSQPQEVHLQQANGFTCRVRPTGNDRPVLGAFPHGDMVQQWHRRHNHGTGVHTSLTDDAFKPPSRVENLLHIGISFDELANLSGFTVPRMLRVDDAGQRNILRHNRRRQSLRNPLRHLETRLPEVRASRVFQRLLRLHRAEGNNLGDLVFAPVICRVANHLTAAAIVEVDIDIRCRRALRVKESLEQQSMLERIDIRNSQRVRNQGPCS